MGLPIRVLLENSQFLPRTVREAIARGDGAAPLRKYGLTEREIYWLLGKR